MPSSVAVTPGTTTIVAASAVPAGFCVRVIAFLLSFSGTGVVTFTGTTGTTLSGPYYGIQGTSVVSPELDGRARGQFQTKPNEGLVVNASNVGGHVVYELVSQI